MTREQRLLRRKELRAQWSPEQKARDLEHKKRTREKHGDKYREIAKQKAKENVSWFKLVKKKYWQDHPEKYLIYISKSRAKRIGKEFSITEDDISIPEYCPILNIKLGPVSSSIKERDSSPSVDRIDTTKGYIKGNVRVISFRANACKADMTIEDIERLYLYVRDAKRLSDMDSIN